LFMVVYAPGGLASLIMVNLRVIKHGKLRGLLPSYLGFALASLLMLAGAGVLVEMIYHQQLDAALGPDLPFAGMVLNTAEPMTWLVAGGLFFLGLWFFEQVRRRFAVRWTSVHTDITRSQAVSS